MTPPSGQPVRSTPAPSGMLAVNDFSTGLGKARGDSGLTRKDELAPSPWVVGLQKAGPQRAEEREVCVKTLVLEALERDLSRLPQNNC